MIVDDDDDDVAASFSVRHQHQQQGLMMRAENFRGTTTECTGQSDNDVFIRVRGVAIYPFKSHLFCVFRSLNIHAELFITVLGILSLFSVTFTLFLSHVFSSMCRFRRV